MLKLGMYYFKGVIKASNVDPIVILFRKYWLDCFEESLDKFVSQAIKSQPLSADAPSRAQKFREKYIGRLQYLKQHPW